MSRMTLKEWCALTEKPGTWAVMVPVSGYALCDCKLPHGKPHEHRWGGGLDKKAAEEVAKNWGGRIVNEGVVKA